jgi:hypothetical protein
MRFVADYNKADEAKGKNPYFQRAFKKIFEKPFVTNGSSLFV